MTSNEPLPGRCGANCKDGGYCENHAVDGRDRCRMHGGTQPRGMESPNAVHCLRSDYFSEKDREIYDEVRQHDNADLIQEEIWSIKTKLLRAAREAGGDGGAEMVSDLINTIEDGQDVDRELVGAFAKLLQTSTQAVDRAIGRLDDLVKTHHKITEGDTVNVEHSGEIDGERTLGDDEQAMLRDALDPES